MTENELRSSFANGAKEFLKDGKYRTQLEWEFKGLTAFKRRVLGFCGQETVKSVDELAEVLSELHVIPSKADAQGFVQKLYGQQIDYGNGRLRFEPVDSSQSVGGCRIIRYAPPVYSPDGV